MQRTIILLFFVSWSAIISSQTVQDFTITDYTGQVHHLYADHLDQGQTVVIKLFFTSCPPCISIAPQVQTKYVDWGEGQYDVEFMELSTKFFDSNQDVANYSSQQGMTMVGAGEDGNSVIATNQFTSGTYGTYYGTPTFVVIAPNGDVNWDVGLSQLDAAIAATGATGNNSPPPPTTYKIDIHKRNGSAFSNPNTQYILSSALNPSVTIDITSYIDGNGQFELPHASIPMVENPTLELINNSGVMDNVTALDLIVIQKDILDIDPITDVDLRNAADVNHSSSISAIDLITIQKVILGIITSWPNRDVWNITFNGCNNCDRIDLMEAPGQTVLLNAKAIKTGDVTNQ